ncbi:MAG: PEP-CTERM sorting domain-containing protein [Planctomycetota bacterium]
MRLGLALLAAAVMAAPAAAAIVVDGALDAEYGLSIATQANTGSSFGPSSNLNAGHGVIRDGKLNLFIDGNLEDNFNKLNIFLDSQAGGQNVLDSDTDNGGTNPLADVTDDSGVNASALQKQRGTTFDAGFEADFMLIIRHGLDQFDVDFVRIGDGAAGDGGFTSDTGSGTIFAPGFDRSMNNSGTTSDGIMVGFNNSNSGGTGFEFGIPLSLIGNPASVDVTAYIGGNTHQFASNQFLGSLPGGSGSLGSDGTGGFTPGRQFFDLSSVTGDQFFTVVPEPGTAVLTLLAAAFAGSAAMRRRLG